MSIYFLEGFDQNSVNEWKTIHRFEKNVKFVYRTQTKLENP